MTSSGGAPNVFSIPAGEPFLTSLATAILRGDLPRAGTPPPDPITLSDLQILLPTRRAVRSLADTFLQVSDGGVQLLPRMTPLGDVDEDELMLGGDPGEGRLALVAAPAISQLDRRLILTRLILAWVGDDANRAKPSVHSPAQAALLAADLGRMIDMFDTEQADWNDLADLVDKELSSHWEDALSFLDLLRTVLPELMAARGEINPMARRNLLLEAEAERLRNEADGRPVIAAGSTGSIPATANLLGVVAALPNGAIVLPGLDTELEDEAWAQMGPAHPQYGLKQLLDRIGISRADVRLLSGGRPRPASVARATLLNEVMRPADATEHWSTAVTELEAARDAGALDGLRRLTAPTQRDEALAIALIMRQTLEDGERSAALVTPDRRLARRVSAELTRWDIAVDDSAGEPLAASAHGTFMLLLAESVASGFAAVPLLGLLKHPLATFGRTRHVVRHLAGLLEISALRGLAPRGGLAGVSRTVHRRRDAQTAGTAHLHTSLRDIRPDDWSALSAFLDDLADMLEPLAALYKKNGTGPAGAFVRAHIACAETACRGVDDDENSSELWQGDAGEALAGFFTTLLDAEALMPALDSVDYVPFVQTLMAGSVVRPRFGRHPRLHIWGLLEARLMQPDVVILGGLTEGVWPPHALTDAWLNRPMRAGLNLEPPERRIGLTAHDFVQAANAPEVYLTHAEKVDGSPTVPSRWLLRLEALLSGLGASCVIEDQRWVSWALGMDHTEDYSPVDMPRPKPSVDARPKGMSVTQVERWIRDPYAIFAGSILKLEPLPPLADDPSAADRGTVIHRILHEAVHGGGEVSVERLLDVGTAVFAEFIDYPDVAAFWWPRFERIARWLVEQDVFDARDIDARFAEFSGRCTLDVAGQPFELRARADRIDVLLGGEAVLIDYKTGQPPSDKQVAAGLSPQLPLEAAIAMAGGFVDCGARAIAGLEYIRLSGGEPPGERRRIKAETPQDLAQKALDGLKRRIAAFNQIETPYLPRVAVETERQAYDYDHLARHMEWARQAGRER